MTEKEATERKTKNSAALLSQPVQQTFAPWKCANGRPIASRQQFGLMGVINLAPDSFYDGGACPDLSSAVARARLLLESGADILDLGAESTRPGSVAIPPELERHRLADALLAIRAVFPESVISVDTTNAPTALFSLESGANVINDISGMGKDPELLDVLAQYKPAYVLTYNPLFFHESRDRNAVDRMLAFFESKLALLTGAGMPEDHIALDPGIGFGKDVNENLEILTHIGELSIFGRTVMVGISMKSLFGDLLGLHLTDRGESTSVASALLWQKGAFWHRVHNVAQTRNALFLARALAGLKP